MSINRRSINVLSATGVLMNTTSAAFKGDSYYGFTDGLHTMQAQYAAFAGRVHIQATLALSPVEADWFDLPITGFTVSGLTAYKDCTEGSPVTGTDSYTFQGNYAHVRVKMDRAHIDDGTTYNAAYGQIIRVIMSA